VYFAGQEGVPVFKYRGFIYSIHEGDHVCEQIRTDPLRRGENKGITTIGTQ
jgi:hypothetical protein